MPAQERNAFDNYLAYASAKRVLDAVTTMRQEMLDRITALPTVTIRCARR